MLGMLPDVWRRTGHASHTLWHILKGLCEHRRIQKCSKGDVRQCISRPRYLLQGRFLKKQIWGGGVRRPHLSPSEYATVCAQGDKHPNYTDL